MGRNIGTLQKVPLKIDDEDDFDNASQNKRPRHQDPHKQHSQHNPYDPDDDNDDEIKVSLTKQRSASKYFLITPEMNVQKIIAIFFASIFFISAIGGAAFGGTKSLKYAPICIQGIMIAIFGVTVIIILGLMFYLIRNFSQDEHREEKKKQGFLPRLISWFEN